MFKRIFWFSIGVYAGIHISENYDYKKIIANFRKEVVEDPDMKILFKKIKSFEKEKKEEK
jgi:hypothetical protein